jgi:hypothetical protein
MPARALPCGERLQATLICVLRTEPAPYLQLLHEPTDKIDQASIVGERPRAPGRRHGRRQRAHADGVATTDAQRKQHPTAGGYRAVQAGRCFACT